MARLKRWLTPAALLLALLLAACARNQPEATDLQVTTSTQASGQASAPNLRKVIRHAALEIEVQSVNHAYARAEKVAAAHGGYVATSQREAANDGSNVSSASLTLRVPSAKLDLTLLELRALTIGSLKERLTSEDVSDEVVDVDARLRNLRRLEEQLLELLKTAGSIEAALKVHHEVAAARAEIERLEGRRQLLERETSWATIGLELSQRPSPVAAASVLARSLAGAHSDAVSGATRITAGAIRIGGALAPILLLVVLPLSLALLGMRKLRRKRARAA